MKFIGIISLKTKNLH